MYTYSQKIKKIKRHEITLNLIPTFGSHLPKVGIKLLKLECHPKILFLVPLLFLALSNSIPSYLATF